MCDRLKKKEKVEDTLPETWDEAEDKGASLLIKDVVPPPPPPTKDEMAQNLKKIVEKKKEAIEAKAPILPSQMDKLGGFRINPAALTNSMKKDDGGQESKRKSRDRVSDSDSDLDRKDKRSTSSRSRSR